MTKFILDICIRKGNGQILHELLKPWQRFWHCMLKSGKVTQQNVPANLFREAGNSRQRQLMPEADIP